MVVQEKWSSRELERQFKAALFERSILQPVKVAAVLRQSQPDAQGVFRDMYLVDFLALPEGHDEADLHHGLVRQLKDFLIELGRDFCFAGSQYPLQVGGRDFALDLLFFHRGLNCLVAIELKDGRFEPEYLGKLSFYLEALDRDVKKPHENPAIGLLLCASKDDEVVEYALSGEKTRLEPEALDAAKSLDEIRARDARIRREENEAEVQARRLEEASDREFSAAMDEMARASARNILRMHGLSETALDGLPPHEALKHVRALRLSRELESKPDQAGSPDSRR